MTLSILSGNSLSTSFFKRLNKNGRRTLCNLLIIKRDSSSLSSILLTPNGAENHSSKLLSLLNIFGRIKFKILQSSCKLFCNGVPVNINLNLDEYWEFKVIANLELLFFILCPSSMMVYSHLTGLRICLSLIIYSNVVNKTTNCRCFI
eukprot:NODE_4_length_77007_cov_1.156642.p64 type:complete len:148 gc:universal NODE_4_length_77007_cov_1.156642:43320-43763(+)